MFFEMLKQLFEKLFGRKKYGTLNVTVTNTLNNPIKNATVQIAVLNRTAITDANGKVVFRNLPYNTYIVKVITS